MSVAPTAAAVWVSVFARSRVTLRKILEQFSKLFFVASECQNCAALTIRFSPRSFIYELALSFLKPGVPLRARKEVSCMMERKAAYR